MMFKPHHGCENPAALIAAVLFWLFLCLHYIIPLAVPVDELPHQFFHPAAMGIAAHPGGL